MAAVRFALGNRPAISARGAGVVGEILMLRGTPGASRLAGKIMEQAASEDRLIADLVLNRREMVELLKALNDHAARRRLDSDSMFRLRAELEAVVEGA